MNQLDRVKQLHFHFIELQCLHPAAALKNVFLTLVVINSERLLIVMVDTYIT